MTVPHWRMANYNLCVSSSFFGSEFAVLVYIGKLQNDIYSRQDSIITKEQLFSTTSILNGNDQWKILIMKTFTCRWDSLATSILKNPSLFTLEFKVYHVAAFVQNFLWLLQGFTNLPANTIAVFLSYL